MQTLSVHDHHLGMMQTYTGRIINMRKPQVTDIDIYDIAHALSHICRFGGHCNEFYSVAQHCVMASLLAPKEYKLQALLHDAAEAYLGDVIKPLKIIIGDEYEHLEAIYEETIAEAFGIEEYPETLIKELDYKILEIENEAVRNNNMEGLQDLIIKHYYSVGWIWTPQTAKKVFISAFYKYNNLQETSNL